ncbi:MAG: polysaccharide deacetylase family protein [Acidobacteria bacterium]|nr:MAG: polysaccharide deacetylase family protein [Acidobacteriota bacterium]
MSARPLIVNAMTIDVEDYFHVSVFDGVVPRRHWEALESRVERNTDRLLALFEDAGIKATFFILGWVAERHPALVGRVAALGHEIASHGYGHRLVYDLTPRTFREDIRRSKGALESMAGRPVRGYRAPSYSITPHSLWALDILIEEGFQYDASIFPIHHDRYGIPISPRHPYPIHRDHGTIVEVPGSTVRIGPYNLPVGGGGYFRILPYWWTKRGIERLNRDEQRPAVFYLHPWEIDPDQPKLMTSALGRFRHYRNLGETEARLTQLLRDFEFAPMEQVMLPASVEDAPSALAFALPYVW